MHAGLWIPCGLLAGTMAAWLLPRFKPQTRSAVDPSGFVPAGGNLAVRARLESAPQGVTSGLERVASTLENALLRRDVAGYFAAPTPEHSNPVRVKLKYPTPLHELQRHNEFELDLASPQLPSPLNFWRTGTQLSAVTLAALVATYVADALQGLQSGRETRQPLAASQTRDYLPPQTRPLQPAVQGRWLLASLATPSGHPFRTSVVATGYIAGTSIPPTTTVTATPHGNTPTPHTNNFTGAYASKAGYTP